MSDGFWKRIRDVAMIVMVMSTAVASFRFTWLPAMVPDICTILTAIAGGLGTVAANKLPSTRGEKKEVPDGNVSG